MLGNKLKNKLEIRHQILGIENTPKFSFQKPLGLSKWIFFSISLQVKALTLIKILTHDTYHDFKRSNEFQNFIPAKTLY